MLNGSNSKDSGVMSLMQQHGVEGIWYRDGRPDFTPFAMFNVQVENMPTYRTGAGGSYDLTRNAIANEMIKSNGNINTLMQNGVLSEYATPKTKKQVQSFLQDSNVQQMIQNKDVSNLKKYIADYQTEYGYTIHEVDTKNVQLVPTEINSKYNHDGGISDQKKKKKCGGA